MQDNYLQSLIGKGVQIHRGGPDSNTGKLLDVTEEYVALQKDDGEIIYFKTSHIKSIRENAMIKFNSLLNPDETFFIKASKFQEMASQLKKQHVRINGKNSESRVGRLIDVREDYVIIYTEVDGLIFYKDQHIKSLSTPIKKMESINVVGEKETNPNSEEIKEEIPMVNVELENLLKISSATTLNGVLKNLKYSWIKVNRKGPESVEGLLIDSNDQHLLLAVDREVLRISTYHIKNFSVNTKTSKEDHEVANNSNDELKGEFSGENESKEQKSKTVSQAQLLFEEHLKVATRKRNRRIRKKVLQNKWK